MNNKVCLKLNMPAVEAARRILQAQLEYMELAYKDLADADLEISARGVHDLRVAVRRSMSALKCFAPWLDRKWTRQYADEFKALLRPLGKTRDTDIIRANLRHFSVLDKTNDCPSCRDIIEKQQRLHAKIAARTGKSFLLILNRKLTDLRDPAATIAMNRANHKSGKPVRLYRLEDCLPRILFEAAGALTAWRGSLPEIPGLENPVSDIDGEIMHRIRISAKHFRYCLEFFAGLPGCKPAATLEDLRTLQEALGNWHDSFITGSYLLKQKTKHPGDSLLGELAVIAEEQTRERQENFREIWPRYNPARISREITSSLEKVYSLKSNQSD